MYIHPLTLAQAQAREAMRAKRDAPFLAAFTPGDAGREHERETRAAVLGAALEAAGAPDPHEMAAWLLRAVGAKFIMESRDPGDLGFAAEIALAGHSALDNESDFGAWEVKSTFGMGHGVIRLLAWHGRRHGSWLAAELARRRSGVITFRAVTIELGGGLARTHLRDADLVWSPSREGLRHVVSVGHAYVRKGEEARRLYVRRGCLAELYDAGARIRPTRRDGVDRLLFSPRDEASSALVA